MTGHGHHKDHAGERFELKPLSPEGVPAALEKAHRYRLLNEPFEAESICRDVLIVDPGNQAALITLILAITDQFGSEGGSGVSDARDLLDDLDGDYERSYYAGIICERRGHDYLHRMKPGTGPVAYDWFRKAMVHYETALDLRPAGNDDTILRWNTCARLIMQHAHVKPLEHSRPPMLE